MKPRGRTALLALGSGIGVAGVRSASPVVAVRGIRRAGLGAVFTEELAAFFVRNADPDYISHSEVQDGRAISFDEWGPRFEERVLGDIEWSLEGSRDAGDSLTGPRMVLARREGVRLGIALVHLDGESPGRFATIEDLVVDRARRDSGIGGHMVEFIVEQLEARGIRRLFLESGVRNRAAHRFLERHGFRTCSVVMSRRLGERE